MTLSAVTTKITGHNVYESVDNRMEFDTISRTENNLVDPVGVLVHDEICLAIRQTIWQNIH